MCFYVLTRLSLSFRHSRLPPGAARPSVTSPSGHSSGTLCRTRRVPLCFRASAEKNLKSRSVCNHTVLFHLRSGIDDSWVRWVVRGKLELVRGISCPRDGRPGPTSRSAFAPAGIPSDTNHCRPPAPFLAQKTSTIETSGQIRERRWSAHGDERAKNEETKATSWSRPPLSAQTPAATTPQYHDRCI